MTTPLQEVYDFLLAKTDAKEWAWTEDMELLRSDWEMLLKLAIQDFMFPRIDLSLIEIVTVNSEGEEVRETVFANDLTDAEKVVLATYMKHEWLKRTITNWKNIEMMYTDKDFKISGKAAHLMALLQLEAHCDEETRKVVNRYARKAFDYSSLSGSPNG